MPQLVVLRLVPCLVEVKCLLAFQNLTMFAIFLIDLTKVDCMEASYFQKLEAQLSLFLTNESYNLMT